MKPATRLPLFVAIAIVFAVIAATILVRAGRGPADVASDTAPVAREAPAPAAAGPAAPRAAPTPVRGAAVESAVLNQLEERTRKREELRARTAALKEQSARRYASEQVDPAWAPTKMGQLDGIAADPAFSAAGAVPSNLDIDCRSSMCRIDGQFEDASKAEDWIMLYTASLGSALPNTVISRSRNPDGTMRVEIYGRGR